MAKCTRPQPTLVASFSVTCTHELTLTVQLCGKEIVVCSGQSNIQLNTNYRMNRTIENRYRRIRPVTLNTNLRAIPYLKAHQAHR
jgi:hypothetical protein